MDCKIILIFTIVVYSTTAQQDGPVGAPPALDGTTVVQDTPAMKPLPPKDVQFQLTSHDSFVLAWSSPPEPLDYYLIHYFPDGETPMELTVNKTETHFDVVNPDIMLPKLGVKMFSVFGDEVSDEAEITVLSENDPRPVGAPPALDGTTVVQDTPAMKPLPPKDVQFQLTSHDSFVLAWSSPPEPLDYYLIHYFPDGETPMELTVNKTETHFDVVNPDIMLPKLGVNMFSVFGDEVSDEAEITVLSENDPRLPPGITSGTKQWVDNSTVQLQWLKPQGAYDSLLLLYAPEDGGLTAQSRVLDKSQTSFKIMGLTQGTKYVIHVYTVRNGIHSDQPVFMQLAPSENSCETNPYPCKNEGQCVQDENDQHMFKCQCESGFNGIICEKGIDECSPNPCMNDGTCREQSNGYTCTCKTGYVGEHCELGSDGEGDGVAGLRASVIITSLVTAAICIIL